MIANAMNMVISVSCGEAGLEAGSIEMPSISERPWRWSMRTLTERRRFVLDCRVHHQMLRHSAPDGAFVVETVVRMLAARFHFRRRDDDFIVVCNAPRTVRLTCFSAPATVGIDRRL